VTGASGERGGDLFSGLSSADVATAGRDRVGVVLGLPPAWRHASLVASAYTASGVAGDNLVLHRALAEAPPGSALVASRLGDTPAGHWGELMCVAASAAGIRGLVVSGTVRDVARIEARRFPVFHAGVAPRPATKSHPGELGQPVCIGDVTISTGDLIVADADGIVVVPRSHVDVVLSDVAALQHRETELVKLLEGGMTTLEALGLE
jgi:4-hydroxy-4-methyl-2-oxoglutarate aldolase